MRVAVDQEVRNFNEYEPADDVNGVEIQRTKDQTDTEAEEVQRCVWSEHTRALVAVRFLCARDASADGGRHQLVLFRGLLLEVILYIFNAYTENGPRRRLQVFRNLRPDSLTKRNLLRSTG